MYENGQKSVFSENLNALLQKRKKTQKEAAAAIGVSPQTFNTWSKGIALPRMEKLEKLAEYFSIPKFALLEKQDIIGTYSEGSSKPVKVAGHDKAVQSTPLDTQLLQYTVLLNEEGKERLVSRAKELIRLGYTKPGKKKLQGELRSSHREPSVHNETIEYFLL